MEWEESAQRSGSGRERGEEGTTLRVTHLMKDLRFSKYEDVSKYSETQHVHGSPRRTMDSARQLLSQVNQPCQFARP